VPAVGWLDRRIPERKDRIRRLQLLGASGFAVVVFTHFAEMFDLLPGMRWGVADSPGHYLDLASAVLALTLFPTGYLIHALRQ